MEIVYVSNCGKKYHFNPQCSYIKGKAVNSLPLNSAKIKFGGPCSRCINSQNILMNNNNQFKKYYKNNIFNNNISSNNKNQFNNYLKLQNNLDNNNFFGNNNFVQNNNHIFDELSNNKKINKGNLYNINNDNVNDKKINDINNEKSILESKDKISDFFMLSGSGSVVDGGGFNLNKKVVIDEKSSEIDFNNNKFSTVNKNIPFLLNNISNIPNFDLSNDNDSSNFLINKNEWIKEEEKDDGKYIENIVKKFDNTKNEEKKNKNYNLLNKKENDKKKGSENNYDNGINFNIINNQINNISNQKDENAFFSNSKINDSNEEKSNNNSKIKSDNNIFFIYNIDNSSNKINISNNKDNILPSSLSNQKFKKRNQKKKIKINKDEFNLIKETNSNAIILSLENSILPSINTTHITNTTNLENNKIDKKKNDIDENDIFKKGNYKFSFEINPKINSKICINIEVGFEIDFFDENDINEEEEIEDSINENDNIILDSGFQKICVLRRLNIYKKTNQIYVLINIGKGKFFILGEKEFNDIIINKGFIYSNILNILFISNCQIIPLEKIKDIKPIFNYNKKDLNIAEIFNNGRKIEK